MLELDEMWVYVQKRNNKQWLWLALCRRTRQIIGYFIGLRGIKACKQFKANLAPAYHYLNTTSDRWNAYKKVFNKHRHESSQYSGKTSHVERCNVTIRARMGGLTRKSLSFSKIQCMHELAIHFFINKYNQEKAKIYRKPSYTTIFSKRFKK